MRNMPRKTLITHLKKHLVMSKDYYTKAEVNKLLADQKEEILAILSKPSKKELNSFELKMYGGRIMRLQVIDIIFHELSNNKLIDVVSKKVFRDAFLGNDIKKETKKSLINWLNLDSGTNLPAVLCDLIYSIIGINIEKLNASKRMAKRLKTVTKTILLHDITL